MKSNEVRALFDSGISPREMNEIVEKANAAHCVDCNKELRIGWRICRCHNPAITPRCLACFDVHVAAGAVRVK